MTARLETFKVQRIWLRTGLIQRKNFLLQKRKKNPFKLKSRERKSKGLNNHKICLLHLQGRSKTVGRVRSLKSLSIHLLRLTAICHRLRLHGKVSRSSKNLRINNGNRLHRNIRNILRREVMCLHNVLLSRVGVVHLLIRVQAVLRHKINHQCTAKWDRASSNDQQRRDLSRR